MTNSQAHSSCVSIIVPTLNEEENIEPLVSQIIVRGVPFREILFVDDRSTDGTREKICAVAGDQPIRLIALRFFVRWLRAMVHHLARGTSQTKKAGDLTCGAEVLHHQTPVK
jgi:cellulose synthase/poly-beta-1,6-N-acetylglucosamine synthase-like glycosyltransferase